jgi:two-component system, NarL family, response regulator LiaR
MDDSCADRIRVLIADDNIAVRRALATFLLASDDLELAGEAAGGREAIDLCLRTQPDVVLIDLTMPGMDGVAATQFITDGQPHPQIIALTGFHEDDLAKGALQAGAIDYLLKNVSADELATAIRAAYAGRSTLAPEATQALMQRLASPLPPANVVTSRELEVLAFMAQGLNNVEISERLEISRSTVKFHVSKILSKLGVTTRTEAVALAVQRHLLP